MVPLDPKPSADAHAVATSTVLLAIIDQLLSKGILDREDVANAIRTAIQGIGPRIQTTPEGYDASQILLGLLRQFAKPQV
jgi:hypothetical protein